MQAVFTVLGKPIGKERPRVVSRNGFSHSYTPLKTKKYEELVQWSYRQQCGDIYFSDREITAHIQAYFPIPKSYPMKKKMKLYGQPYPHKPDADNIAKSILDGLNGLAYQDDSQVVTLNVEKTYINREDTLFRGAVYVTLQSKTN